MKRTYVALVAMLAILAILLIVDITVQLRSKAVCHAITEDSVITDCDYHNGTWSTK